MFLSEEAFNKYSIFGKFENQIKSTVFNLENESKFEVIPFLNYCETNTKWYNTLLDVMVDKDLKLNPDRITQQQKQHLVKTPPPNEIVAQTSVSATKEIPSKQVSNQTKKETPVKQPKAFDQKTYEIMKTWYPLRFKLNYPQKSVLSSYEQKEFIELFKKFQNRTHLTQKEVKLYKQYVHYRNLVEKERNLFLEYSKRYFQNASEDYEYCNEITAQYINEMIQYLTQIPLKYNRYFAKIDEFPIEHNEMSKANFELEKSLVQLGNIPKVILPSITLGYQPNLTIAYTPINKRAPSGHTYKKMSKIVIQDDPNAEKLAIKYKANIVMTNSAFVNLIYQLSKQNEDEFKMPVIVKNLNDDSDGTVQRVAFIDKPFVSKHLTQRNKNEKFYKRSLMVTLIKNQIVTRNFKKHHSQTSIDTPNTPNETIDQTVISEERKDLKPNDVNVNYEAENNLESFGVYKKEEETNIAKKRQVESPTNEFKELEVKKKFKQSEPSPIAADDYEEYDESDTENALQIVDNNEPAIIDKIELKEAPQEPEEPDSMNFDQPNIKPMVIPLDKVPEPNSTTTMTQKAKTTSPKTIVKTEEESSLTLLDLISKMQEKLITASNTASNHKTPVQHILSNLTTTTLKTQLPSENIKEYVNIENIHGNVNYNLWVINSTSMSLRILVRSSISGYVNTESSSRTSVVLHNKLEYQPQFGSEKLSHRDYCFMWAKSFIRNHCDVLLCRINIFTSKLIAIKTLNHKDILAGYTNFNPQQTINNLRVLLEKLTKLENGDYLISKEINEKNLTIMKSISQDVLIIYFKRKSLFDLHQYYSEPDTIHKKPEWNQIDPDIYLPYHYHLHRVPCTFEPADKNAQQQQGKGNKQKKRKNKGKSK